MAAKLKTQAVDRGLVSVVDTIVSFDRKEITSEKAIAEILKHIGNVYDLAYTQGVGVGFAEGIAERIGA